MGLGGQDFHKDDPTIGGVAAKLKAGADPTKFTLPEKKVAYAIAMANLETSGEIRRITELEQAKAKYQSQAPKKGSAVLWDGKTGSEQVTSLQAALEMSEKSAAIVHEHPEVLKMLASMHANAHPAKAAPVPPAYAVPSAPHKDGRSPR